MQKENVLLEDIKSRFETTLHARSLAVRSDEGLLEFLLKDSKFSDEYRARFFKEICGSFVFLKEDFIDFLDLRLLNASFTSFGNKIGLGSIHKKYLRQSDEVVLNFPFKDGVIKGGQSRDESKSEEIFFNEILARSEIDVLFSPKALQNFELVTTGGGGVTLIDSKNTESIANALSDNCNLLIKGNNLLALHTLKKRKDIYGKVKLIYIDPPYNTGSDSFNYNDRFNHSTWLTFMKNRLEIAREFLRDDGVIFIQCDDNEQAYLKVLCDEIFGRENFVGCFVWERTKTPARLSKNIAKKHEYILCYAKKLTF